MFRLGKSFFLQKVPLAFNPLCSRARVGRESHEKVYNLIVMLLSAARDRKSEIATENLRLYQKI